MMRWKALLSVPFLLITLGAFAQEPAYVEGDILVMLREGTTPEVVVRDLQEVEGTRTGLRTVKEVSAPMRVWLLHFDARTIEQHVMLRAVRDHAGVQLAQNNHLVKERAVPNDPQFGDQWHHTNINSTAAWDISTGGVTATGDTIVVCIIERCDLSQPDLAANAWHNNGEVPDNGVDDAGNGYVDDHLGWNTPTGNDAVYATNHGTQVAGMIGAVGNNGVGVVGANWNVKMMPVAYGGVQEAQVVAAYTYPLIMRRRYNDSNGATGAFVVVTNASWGIDNGQPEDSPVWCAMFDTLGTEGVLSCGSTANNNVDVDLVGDMPTACPSDYMISVTATDVNDNRTFSGYGATTIDVGAPGAAVLTTNQTGGFSTANGTSFAAPLTAGVVALLYSAPCPSLMALVQADPAAGALQVRDLLFDGVDEVGNLPGSIVTGGRINAGTSIQLLMNACGPCPAPYGLDVHNVDLTAALLSWNVVSGSTFDIRYREIGAVDWIALSGISSTAFTISGLQTCTPYEFQVRVICGADLSDYSASFSWISAGCCDPPDNIIMGFIGENDANLTWSTVIGATSYDVRIRPVGAVDWTVLEDEVNNFTTISGLLPCMSYEVQLASVCNGVTGEWSGSELFSTLGCGVCVDNDYCSSQGQNTSAEWIERVAFNNVDHTSGNDGGYGDHTDVSGYLDIGPAQSITLVPGYITFAYSEWWSIWVDLDQDGIFSEPERLYQSTAGINTSVVASIDVPADAMPGTTRMRVVMKYGSNVSDACTSFSNGEVEDYCVNLVHGIGMEEIPSTTVLVHPSPADDHLIMTLSGELAQGRSLLLVQDATGRAIVQQIVQGPRDVLNTSTFSEGLYHYSVLKDDRRLAQGRFVVVH
ncbi:MAG: S8 family serine peptidase [Flavobacteriales bacterium]|nr:S8 family serine peptidase [Flavobacteriales bacterium]